MPCAGLFHRRSRFPPVAAILTGLIGLGFSGLAAAQETRSFRIASAPLQVDVDSPIGWRFSFEAMAGDLDMVSVHQDFFGIPWAELAAGDPLPASWLAFQQDIQARAAATGLPVYLSGTGTMERQGLVWRVARLTWPAVAMQTQDSLVATPLVSCGG